MIDIYRADEDAPVGSITEDALDFMTTKLEEEDSEDTDYFIDRDTVDFLRRQDPPAGLIAVLETALGTRDGVDIYYIPQEEGEEESEEDEAEEL